jgi:hypothetical protein
MNYNRINPKAVGNPSMVSKVTGVVDNTYSATPVNSFTAQAVQNQYGQSNGFMGQVPSYNPLGNAVVDPNAETLDNTLPLDVVAQPIKTGGIKPPRTVKTKITPPYNLNNR